MRNAGSAYRPTRWIDGYGLLLVLMILAYFNLVAWVVAALLEFTVEISGRSTLHEPPWLAAYAAYLCGAVPVLAQWLTHALQGVLGLVTARYDDASDDGFELSRQTYPELYAIVGKLARQVHAPPPDRLFASPLAECYVAERRRFALFPDRQLILVVGLPHLAVLQVGDLTAILAHELAHFRRGDTRLGVFCSRFLQTLGRWVELAGRRRLHYIDPLYWLARGYFAVFLRLLVPLRRQQEFRADYWSARVCGGPAAADALLREWVVARQFETVVAAPAASDKRAGETIYDRLTRRWRALSPAGLSYLEGRLWQTESSPAFASHPTLAERVAAMRSLPPLDPPDPTPARVLLRDFPRVAARLQALFDELGDGQHAAPVPLGTRCACR